MKWIEDIKELMKLYGHKVRDKPTPPKLLNKSEKKLRLGLIQEEAEELLEAIDEDHNLDELAKEIIDVLVVTIGCAVTYGIPLDKLWDIVHESNMAKADGPFDPDTGKKLKPEGWVDPKDKIKKLLFPSSPSLLCLCPDCEGDGHGCTYCSETGVVNE